MIELLKRQ